MNLYTIIVYTENKPGVLYRIADLFLRRKINIESLTVSETEVTGISRFTIVIKTDEQTIEKLVKQLYRIIEVVKVIETLDDELIFREVAIIKVTVKEAKQRREIIDLLTISQANIVHLGKDFLTIEKTGSEEDINALISLLKPFGLKEFVRSGRIAVLKDTKKLQGKNSK